MRCDNAIDEQSSDISQGVDRALEARELSEDEIDKIGAGTRGLW
jgi:S-adenosylmethionine synthetase